MKANAIIVEILFDVEVPRNCHVLDISAGCTR